MVAVVLAGSVELDQLSLGTGTWTMGQNCIVKTDERDLNSGTYQVK